MFAGFIVLRWIAPEDIGLWQSLLLVGTYSSFVQAGVFNGLNRELPYRLGKGDSSALAFVATCQSFALILGGLLVTGGVLTVFVVEQSQVRWALAAVFVGVASSTYQQFLGATYRARQAFRKLSHIVVAETVMALVTLPVVYYLKYPGLAVRFAVLAVFSAIMRHHWRPFRVPVSLDPRVLLELMKTGVPLFAFGYVASIAATLPRVVLLHEGNVQMVGLYAPVAATMSIMIVVPSAMAQYIYPRMSYMLGNSGNRHKVWNLAWRTSIYSVLISTPVIAVIYIAMPWVIEKFLPEYSYGVNAIGWALMGGVFQGALISVNALNSLKAWKWMAMYTSVRVLGTLVLVFFFFHLFLNPIEGVAFGYALAQAVSWCTALLCIHYATKGGSGMEVGQHSMPDA
jgi:O-antigen/teichoic acid export membrane protein